MNKKNKAKQNKTKKKTNKNRINTPLKRNYGCEIKLKQTKLATILHFH